MKQDLNPLQVLFTDECRATLNVPDGWAPIRVKRQLGGEGVMFWARILEDTLIGPYQIPEGIKISSETYISILKKFVTPFLSKKNDQNFVFMHDNAPVHTSKKTSYFLSKNLVNKSKLMIWPPILLIENLQSLLKQRLHWKIN